MMPLELQALRRYLFFSVAEAAELIGHVSPRAWQYWERGERPIPEAVAQEMRRLVGWRAEAVRQAELAITEMSRAGADGEAAPVKLVWYPTLDDWLRGQKMPPELWRPYCSAAAEISARYGVAIVAPDERECEALTVWLGRPKWPYGEFRRM